MRSSKQILLAVIALVLTQSCSRQKGYFTLVTQQHTPKAIAPKVETSKTVEITHIKQDKEAQPAALQSAEFPLTASITDGIDIKNSEKLAKFESQIKEALNNTATPAPNRNNQQKEVKMNFVQKMIVKKIQKKMAKSAKPVGFHDWSPFLKIGVILLGIGIVLAIFGLGVVGGLAAFIGLIFTILGLLSSV
jgi:hypothetical protein